MPLVKTGKAAEMLGVDVQTLHAWEKSGELSDRRSNVIEIITVFSARLYGARSHKTKRLLNELTDGKEGESEPQALRFAARGRQKLAHRARPVLAAAS